MPHSVRIRIDRPWLALPPRRVGAVPPGLGTPDYFVLIGTDDAPRMRIDVYRGQASGFLVDIYEMETSVIVGFGDDIVVVPYADEPPRMRSLHAYFMRFYEGDGFVLAVSGQDVTRIDGDGTIAWQSDLVALDGVVIERIEHGVIHGQAEWDPPGGWRPFSISTETGALV